MSRVNNPYGQGVNGYGGNSNNNPNPYAVGGATPNDPYLQQQNQSSTSVNSYGAREGRAAGGVGRANPYGRDRDRSPGATAARGSGDQPPRRAGGYGGLVGLPSNPAPVRTSGPEYDPFNPASRGSNGRGGDQRPNPQETGSRRPQKSMGEIMKYIQSNWSIMDGDECVPVKTALQLMDQSSLGLADKEGDFSDTHVDLQMCLKGVVNEHYADFNSAVGTYHKIQNAIRESQTRVRMLKSGLMSVRGGMLTTRPELRGLAETSGQLDSMFGMLAAIDELKGVPARLEERISEKRFLSAVDLLIDSLRSLRRGELESIAALSDMRSYFANQESSLVDILCEELHDHLYLKSPYCIDRWKGKSDQVESDGQPLSSGEGSNAWDRPVYRYLGSLNTTEVMMEDATKNPEADSFYYIHMILESLNKLGFLEEAIQRVENRMPVELYRLVDKTNNEVDARYPSHLRGQLRKEKGAGFPTRHDSGHSQVLDDFLRTLYAKFEAIAEAHRVLHEVVTGIAAREGISKPDRLVGGFKELWKLYQMEIRSILHDYLATDGDGVQRTATNAASTDIFARQQRDKNKKMFKLSEMDKKALGIKAEADELDEILKTSVPGLVNKSRGKGVKDSLDRNGSDNTSAGHKLLIEPGVFNITTLLPPSLAFLQHLRDIVPQTAEIPMSTLTSFLDDFLINVFHPQLEESVTDLCSQCMVDIEAFSEAATWSKHSPHPIFKGTIAFMSLIRSFSEMLSSIPQDQMFTQLVINQLVRYYDKCFGFYKAVASRVAASGTNTLTLKAAALFAEPGKLRDAAVDILQAKSPGLQSSEKEVSELLLAAKASPISSFDIISDPKSIRQLCLLYNSMKWLASALAQLRHVDAAAVSTTSHARSTSKSENVRRWTLIKPIKPPNASASGSTNFLPLTSETVVPFDQTLSSFGNLATTSLLTLHFDVRCLVIYSLSHVLRGPDLGKTDNSPSSRIDSSAFPPLSSGAYPFVLPSPPSSASALILQLNNDLIAFDASISSNLGLHERRFIVYGLSKLVDNYMVAGADNILVMNANGAEKLRVDAIVMQQNLRGITADTSEHRGGLGSPVENGLGITQDGAGAGAARQDDGRLSRTHQYYTLFLDGPDQVIDYDELRTLIELCWSEKLRGEDREESVRARKRSGDVLLELGELIWDSDCELDGEMRIATLQFNPQVGQVAANFSRAESLLMRDERHGLLRDLDLLVLPELAFAGYNHPSLAAIAPFLEPTAAGPSTRWASRTAKRLKCTVAVGYAEAAAEDGGNFNTVFDDKITADEGTVAYNALVVTDSTGNVVAHYRKAFLYYTDETWAKEGDGGFYAGVKVAAGICMDINPYRFEAAWSAYEFANHVRESRARVVVLSMAWLTHISHEELVAEPDTPDMNTVSYWLARFQPLMGEATGPEEEVIVVFANRCGEEGTAPRVGDVRYAGSSCVLSIKKGRAVKIWDILGRAQEGVLLVDTAKPPKFGLGQERKEPDRGKSETGQKKPDRGKSETGQKKPDRGKSETGLKTDLSMAYAAYAPYPVPLDTMNTTNKRKRGSEDIGRNVRTNNASSANSGNNGGANNTHAPAPATDDHDYSALLQGISESNQEDTARTAQAALAGAIGENSYPEPSSFEPNSGINSGFGDASAQGLGGPQNPIYSSHNQMVVKPPVGTPEWHKSRKDMHKEVERRRREVINEGIETIAKIVPGTEKNKGAILQRTAQYIAELQEQAQKFGNERATFDIALKELTSRNERLKASVQHAWAESRKWQKRCQEAGLQFDDYDDGAGVGLVADGGVGEDFDGVGN
ncbi:hypothetical protein DV735_g1603, partial [Chaetothyriales sp. CBS 134920]